MEEGSNSRALDSQEIRVADQQQPQPQPQQPDLDPPYADFDIAYFQKYDSVDVHHKITQDTVLTEKYMTAIKYHRGRIEGKVVMDVGCGTGILSILCAEAGARRVYAVDASAIAAQAEENVRAKNLADRVIVLHRRVEDLEDIHIDEKVDVIISNWMGYMLLYENMLGSVIAARDRWLTDGGLILPSSATLYMVATKIPDSKSSEFGRNSYGIDMSAQRVAFEGLCVETIPPQNVLTIPLHVVKHVNCYAIPIDELVSVTTEFKLQANTKARMNGFAFWFDVEFSADASKSSTVKEALKLSTAPVEHPTHWQQTVISLDEPVDIDKAQLIKGTLTLSPSKENPRIMNIHLEYTAAGRSSVKRAVMW